MDNLKKILYKCKGSLVLKNTVILALFTLLAKVLGFVRQIYVGYKFGPGEITDAFLVTNLIPTLIFTDLSVAIQTNYIPIASSFGEDKQKKNIFTSNLINISLIVMVVGIIILNSIPSLFINIFAMGLSEQAKNYAISMLQITSFSIIPIVLSYIFKAFTQIEGRFFSTAFTPVIINIIALLFVCISTPQRHYLLSIGIVVANLIVMAYLLLEVRKNGFQYSVQSAFKDSNIRKMAVLTIPLIGENVASNLNIIVDKNVASLLDSGTLTSITYSNSIINILLTTLVIPISTVLFPKISKDVNSGNKSIERDCVYYSNLLFLVMIPIIIFIGYYSDPIITFLFYRGSFTKQSIKIIYETLSIYIIGLLGMGMKYFLTRFFYALEDTKTPTIISIVGLVINIVLNILLVGPLAHKGVAIATTISYLFTYILLLALLKIKYNFKVITHNIVAIGITCFSGIIGIIVTLLTTGKLQLSHVVMKLLISGIVFVVSYIFVLVLLRYKPLVDMYRTIRKERA